VEMVYTCISIDVRDARANFNLLAQRKGPVDIKESVLLYNFGLLMGISESGTRRSKRMDQHTLPSSNNTSYSMQTGMVC
jgi:hypothetical protein